jgi:hypothetical protein
MAAEDPAPKPRPLARYSRWSGTRRSSATSSRWIFRFVGIPALAFAGVLIYRGVQERFTLPACDSTRAKSTLADVLKQLKTEPLGDEPIQAVSSSKDQVVCRVALPLSDGGSLNIDYSFFWHGSAVDMRYSISRRPARNSTMTPQAN